MAEKDIPVTKRLLNRIKKLGRKSDRPEFTEVGIEKSKYIPHKSSENVPLQRINTWDAYAKSGTQTDAAKVKSDYAVDETLNKKISLHYGDITKLQIDAIVTSASPDLVSLGEVGFDVHTAAGPELSSKCASLAADGICPVGQARLTKGYMLPARYVIHGVGPRGQKPDKLRSCYRSCLEIAKLTHIRTIAFPCISTLFGGYDITEASPVAVSSVREWLLEDDNLQHIDRVIFCVISERNKLLYETVLHNNFPVENPKTVPKEIENDPYALALYEKAIKDGKETDKVIRVNIVGNFGQGKTSLKRRLVGETIDTIQSTNSIDINRYRVTETSNGRDICTYGQEDESKEIFDRIVEVARCTDLQGHNFQGCDIDNDDSLNEGEREIFDEVDGPVGFEPNLNESGDHDEGICTLTEVNEMQKGETLIGDERKRLLEQPKEHNTILTKEELFSLSNEVKCHSEYSESMRIMDIWDFGGQYVYYATHTMFHSRQAIYLLVFDLSTKLSNIIRDEEFPGETGDKDMEYFIRFWMNSIHSFVGTEDGSLPLVILVGTHRDLLDGNEKQKCDEYFDQIRGLFEETKLIYHIHPKDFAVNNHDPADKTFEDLLDEVLQIGDKLSKMVEIPAKWLPLEKALKERKSRKIITFPEVMQIDSKAEFPLSNERQVKLFLQYHHAKGTLFYFDEEPIDNYIVLDTQYLIDAFKCIITSERFCKRLPSIRDSWNKLVTEGKLENVLINNVWSTDSDQKFIENNTILLEFLKKHHIISEAMQYDEGSQAITGLGWYIVPSLLKINSNTSDLTDFLTGRQQTEIRFVMVFENSSLIQTVYSRVVAALLGKWPVVHTPTNPQNIFLFENLGVFRVNIDHAGIIEVRGNTVDLFLLNLCPSGSVDPAVADKFRRYCEAVVEHEFRFLRSATDTSIEPYKRAFRCNHESHGICGSKLIESISTLEKTPNVPCPDLMKHEICSEKALDEWFLKSGVEKYKDTKTLSDKDLGKVAQAIGQNWQLLALELGLSKVQIDQNTANNDNMAMKIFCMLKTWKSQCPSTANTVTLMQAIENTTSLTVNLDKIRNICDEDS